MKFFISSYNGFFLAIPSDCVSSIKIISDKDSEEPEDNLNYVSLPVLLNIPVEITKHGVILKNSNIILLTCRVEREEDIYEKKIYSMPNVLKTHKFANIFNGILFSKESNKLMLVLNPQKLINYIQKGENND